MRGRLFKYSSELIVIVAGISISLFFDELAEDYKKNRLEVYYLQSLIENLQEDSIRLKEAIGFMGKVNDACDVLFQNYLVQNRIQITPTSLANSHTILLQHTIFAANQSVYEELKSTGSFITIKNKSLKNAIFNYYGATVNIKTNDISADNVVTNYVYPRLNDNYTLGKLATLDTSIFHIDQATLNISDKIDDRSNQNEIINATVIRKGINAAQKDAYVKLSKSNQDLMSSIRKVLSEK